MARWLSAAVGLLLWLSPPAAGLYEEQAGQFDWNLEMLGRVSQAAFAPKGRPRVYVATDEAVIASLNSRNGSTVWRQVLPEGDRVLHLAVSLKPPAVITLTADGWWVAW